MCSCSILQVKLYFLIDGSCGITFVVAFGFLSQNFGRWQGPTNGTLSFYECRLSDGGTQTLPVVMKFV